MTTTVRPRLPLVVCFSVLLMFVPFFLRGRVRATDGTDYSQYKQKKLIRLLFYRGIECDHCTSKAEWVELMRQNAHLEESAELKEEWERLKEYTKKAEQHNTTKEDFLESIKTNMSETLEERAADSVWNYFQQQLRDGSVQFQEDGSASFLLPISIHLDQYLHPSVANTLDALQFGGRKMYFRLPRLWRMKIERSVDSNVVTMVLGTIIVGLLIILIFDCVQEARGNKDGDKENDGDGEEEKTNGDKKHDAEGDENKSSDAAPAEQEKDGTS